ncbi:hypothetical protein P9112_000081 [Eukaryota sp. TZLM1-RC]
MGHFSSKFYVGAILMMIFGTGTMISAKLMLDSKSIGIDGRLKNFDKPWFQSMAMFVSMSFCMLFFFEGQRRDRVRQSNTLLTDNKPRKVPDSRSYYLIAIPALFDLLATTIMTMSLILLPVSTMQLLRGSMVVFSAILNVTLLKRKLLPYRWFGVLLVSIGITCIGFSSVLSSQDEGGSVEKQVLGIILCVASQFIQALQIVTEDLLLSKVSCVTTQVVGMEGVWGSIFCFGLFLPLAQLFKSYGFGEDSIDTIIMLQNSRSLFFMAIAYCISILLLNYAGMTVTSESTSVVRTILEAIRTVFIWLVGLFIYYFITPQFGERWTRWSFLQLFGFFVLSYSMFIYEGIIRVPGFRYEGDYPEIIDQK